MIHSLPCPQCTSGNSIFDIHDCPWILLDVLHQKWCGKIPWLFMIIHYFSNPALNLNPNLGCGPLCAWHVQVLFVSFHYLCILPNSFALLHSKQYSSMCKVDNAWTTEVKHHNGTHYILFSIPLGQYSFSTCSYSLIIPCIPAWFFKPSWTSDAIHSTLPLAMAIIHCLWTSSMAAFPASLQLSLSFVKCNCMTWSTFHLTSLTRLPVGWYVRGVFSCTPFFMHSI